MPTKIFTTIEAECPFGKGVKIDSSVCRSCPEYFRQGTGTFFWCRHPVPEVEPPKRKRGRPAKKDDFRPNKKHKIKKR